MRVYRLILCTGFGILAALQSQSSDATSDVLQLIQEAAEAELRESGIPSVQIAVAREGRVIFQGAYGVADLEQQVPATVQTKFRVASISKWMTATAALALVERGKLDLDAPVQRYCAPFPTKRYAITTRHLLRHEAGIRHEIDYEAALLAVKDEQSRATLERRRDREMLAEYTRYLDRIEPLAIFADESPLFEPGTNWSYSSPGYRIIGCVLEGASGSKYSELMRELVFQKSQMAGTEPDDAYAIIRHRAPGYQLMGNKTLRRAEMSDVSGNLPAGGHLSTATDLVMFADAFASGKLVSNRTVALMVPQLSRTDRQSADAWRDAIPSRANYGYGVMAFPSIEGRWIGHTGRQPGASAILITSIDKRLSIAVLTNAKGWNGYISFVNRLRDIVDSAR